LLSRATMLINTSEWEGFPNIFLEAALSGTPIVSLAIDPDGLLSQKHCGFTARSDLNQLAMIVDGISSGEISTVERTRKMHQYCVENHDARIVGPQLLSILEKI